MLHQPILEGKIQTTPLTAPRATSSRFGLETSLSAVDKCLTPTIVSKYPRIATTMADENSARILILSSLMLDQDNGHFTVNEPDST
jgi:hypothetical protein